MLTIEQIQEKLKDMNLKAVSYHSSVSYGTVVKISKGAKNCNYSSVKKVSDYLENRK